MLQANRGAVADRMVEACIMFQFKMCCGADEILDMQSTRFDLLVEAHNKKEQEKAVAAEDTVKKRFGYD